MNKNRTTAKRKGLLARRNALRVENARLRAILRSALEDAPKLTRSRTELRQGDDCTEVVKITTYPDWIDAARAALERRAA